jgi:hypothetical protein
MLIPFSVDYGISWNQRNATMPSSNLWIICWANAAQSENLDAPKPDDHAGVEKSTNSVFGDGSYRNSNPPLITTGILTIKFITNASTRALNSIHYQPPSRPPLWPSPTSDKTFTTAKRIANNFAKPSKLNKYLSSTISATKTPLRSSTTSGNVKQKMKLIECLKTFVEKIKKRA